MPIEIVTGMWRVPWAMANGSAAIRPAQPLGDHGRHRHVGFRHHDDEFLAAVTASEIDAADRALDAERKVAQHVVAGIVAGCR